MPRKAHHLSSAKIPFRLAVCFSCDGIWPPLDSSIVLEASRNSFTIKSINFIYISTCVAWLLLTSTAQYMKPSPQNDAPKRPLYMLAQHISPPLASIYHNDSSVSPRHCATVTGLYPFSDRFFSINSVKLWAVCSWISCVSEM